MIGQGTGDPRLKQHSDKRDTGYKYSSSLVGYTERKEMDVPVDKPSVTNSKMVRGDRSGLPAYEAATDRLLLVLIGALSIPPLIIVASLNVSPLMPLPRLDPPSSHI